MNKVKQLLIIMLAAVLPLMLVGRPVLALDGSDDSHQETETETESQDTARMEEIREAAKQKAEHAREAAKQAAEDRHEKSTLTPEELQKKCEERKKGLTKKVENINKNAQKHFDRVTEVYNKALQYQIDNNVTVDNFAELKAAADAAKTQAQASLDTLKDLQPTLDCTQGTVANDVATFKAAVAQARTDLKTYRSSVKDIIKALKAAREGDEQQWN